MTLTLRLVLIVAAMTAFLAAMVIRQADLRANGTEIILPMEPVDPRDMLLGYYVIIRTPAHTLNTGGLEGPDDGWEAGDVAFVTLVEGDDGAWRPSGVWPEDPGSGRILRGRVSFAYQAREDAQTTQPEPGDERAFDGLRDVTPRAAAHQILNVSYNLERYYADASYARDLDDMRRDNRLRLIVSVNESGDAVIKGLEVDGEARYDSLF